MENDEIKQDASNALTPQQQSTNVLHFSKEVISCLDFRTSEWALNLKADDIAIILQAVYRIPGVINSLRSMITSRNVHNNEVETRNVTTESRYAADIGKQGEQTFAKLCQSLPDSYQLVNTAKQGKAGDFVIYYTDGRVKKSCLVDIKKYSTTVPKKELDKFYEDLTFGYYDAGLIISYNTKFVGIHENIFLEEKDMSYGKIPIMYLANVPEDFIIYAIKIVMMKAGISADKEVSYTKLESMLSYVNSALAQSSMTRRTLSELNHTVSNSIQKCQEQLISLEIQVKRTINEISGHIETSIVESYSKIKTVTIPARDDNIKEDNVLDPTSIPELPPYVPSESNKSLSELTPAERIRKLKESMNSMRTSALRKPMINLSEICPKDHTLVKRLNLMDWNSIDGYTLDNDAITIRLEPMRTKTKVHLEQTCEGLDKFVAMFKSSKPGKPKSSERYVTDLTDDLVQMIELTFELTNADDDADDIVGNTADNLDDTDNLDSIYEPVE